MSRSLARKFLFAGAAFVLATSLTVVAAAAPAQILGFDTDSASYNSFVGIYGAGFGDDPGQVQFTGATSVQIPLWSDGLIIARIPAGAQTGLVQVVPTGGAAIESPVELKIHSGSIYVVSTAGNDSGPGNEMNPFQSLHKALSMVQPGDTVLVHAGTYDEQDMDTGPRSALYFRPENAGTQAKPITWRGYGAEVPVLRATQPLAKDDPIIYVDASYLRLARFEINGANNTAAGVSVWASNTWLVGLDVHDFGQTGITVGETNDAVVAASHIHDGGTRPDLDHGVVMLGTGGTIRNNEIEGLPNGYGVFLAYQTESTTNVFGNFIHDVAGGGIGLSRVKGGNRIYNNIVWKAGLSQGCRCAVQVAYGQAAGETDSPDRIYYNTFVGPTVTCMFMADRAGSIEMHGNIFSGFRVGIRVDDDVSKPSLSSSHNLWFGEDDPPEFKWGGPWIEYTEFKTQSQQEGASLLVDPMLQSPASGDMHLTSGSPAIDSGGGPDTPSVDYDGVPRPDPTDGPADMGAFEYTGQAGSGGGGSGGSAGQAGSAGSAGTAGASGAAGAGATAGAGGGSSGSGGGTSGSGGSHTDAGTEAGTSSSGSEDGGGCGCSLPKSNSQSPLALLLGLATLALTRRRP